MISASIPPHKSEKKNLQHSPTHSKAGSKLKNQQLSLKEFPEKKNKKDFEPKKKKEKIIFKRI